jgi:excinuclease UvrABC nuclease subunit
MAIKKFTNTKNITKENIERIPKNKPGIYRIKNNQNKTIYIGMAKRGRLNKRIAEHRGEFKGGTRFQYKLTANKKVAEKMEQREIKNCKPIFNKNK